MNYNSVLLGMLAYTAVTFPLAVLWHIVLFEPLYFSFGYFSGEPQFHLGLLSIIIQGFLLSALYPIVALSGIGLRRGLKFAAIIGFFFWTSHVLAFVAKQAVAQAPLFVVMETGYLAVQFSAFGFFISRIYGRELDFNAPATS
jgi:hypothetical protein